MRAILPLRGHFVEAEGFGVGAALVEALGFAGGFFAEPDADAEALAVTTGGATVTLATGADFSGSAVGVGAPLLSGCQMSPPDGPTANGVAGAGAGSEPQATPRPRIETTRTVGSKARMARIIPAGPSQDNTFSHARGDGFPPRKSRVELS
jgi:hypothetical protein